MNYRKLALDAHKIAISHLKEAYAAAGVCFAMVDVELHGVDSLVASSQPELVARYQRYANEAKAHNLLLNASIAETKKEANALRRKAMALLGENYG